MDDDKIVPIKQNKPKRHRNRPDLANFGQEFIEPVDNTKYIKFAMSSWNMPKVNIENPKEVEERINWYFQRCCDNDMKPGVVGLSNALGVTRQSLWNWKEGITQSSNKESIELVQRAYITLEELWEDYMLNGRVSPPNGIFIGKNHFLYKDTQDVVISPKNDAESEMAANDIAKRYIEDGKKVTTVFVGDDAE